MGEVIKCQNYYYTDYYFQDMNELKTALKNLLKATQIVRPWDYSIMVLDAWLSPTYFLSEELKEYKKAGLIGDFIDYILGLNANNWVHGESYLELADIQAQWVSWWGTRRNVSVKVSANKQQQEKKEAGSGTGKKSERGGRGGGKGRGGWKGRGGQSGNQDGKNKSLPPFVHPPHEGNICIFYNREAGCRNTSQDCVRHVNGERVRMHHKCNHVQKGATGNNELCCKPHPQHEH